MNTLVFILGGIFYGAMEILYRGYTHWSMVLTGGAILLTMYQLAPLLVKWPLPLSALAGAAIITTYEFFVGLLVNKIFHLWVWDYSDQPGNILGQVCPLYSLIWFILCLAFFSLIKYNKLITF